MIGGVADKADIHSRFGCEFAIATPGRLQDFITCSFADRHGGEDTRARRSRPHAGYGFSSAIRLGNWLGNFFVKRKHWSGRSVLRSKNEK